MGDVTLVWLIYVLWLILVVYLTVIAFGAKRDTRPHLGQSFGLLVAIIVAFVLPHIAPFDFVNFGPPSSVAGSIGVVGCLAGMSVLVRGRA